MSPVAALATPAVALWRVVEAMAEIAARDMETFQELADGWRQVQDAEDHGTEGERRMAELVLEARVQIFLEDHQAVLGEAVAP